MYSRGGPHKGQSAFCFISPERKKFSNCKMYTYNVCLLVINFRLLLLPYYFVTNAVTETQTTNNFAHSQITLLVHFKAVKGKYKLYFNSNFYPPQTKGTWYKLAFPSGHCVKQKSDCLWVSSAWDMICSSHLLIMHTCNSNFWNDTNKLHPETYSLCSIYVSEMHGTTVGMFRTQNNGTGLCNMDPWTLLLSCDSHRGAKWVQHSKASYMRPSPLMLKYDVTQYALLCNSISVPAQLLFCIKHGQKMHICGDGLCACHIWPCIQQ